MSELLVGCGGATGTGTPSRSSGTVPSPTEAGEALSSGPVRSVAPTSAANTVAGRWEAAGVTVTARIAPHALALANGSVLLVGNDAVAWETYEGLRPLGCVRRDSTAVEVWDLSTGRWSRVASLPKARAGFAAVALPDGRALVTGGVNMGTADGSGEQWNHSSYSSTYLFDPARPENGWRHGGLLGIARTDPVAAVLPDGRVLVAGGYYLSTETAQDLEGSTGLLAKAPVPVRLTSATLVDADPGPPPVAGLATAEIYDPGAGNWAPTGPMRYARYGSLAATLADGRVLVVGSAWSSMSHPWNGRYVSVSDRAPDTAEIYDPATGRFELTATPPPVALPELDARGFRQVDVWHRGPGQLIALADGGALLVGRSDNWSSYDPSAHGRVVRTLRFDPGSATWTEIDRALYQAMPPGEAVEIVVGHAYDGAAAGRLADGRVLVAGGERATCPIGATCGEGHEPVGTAALYDPVAGVWTDVVPLPYPRSGSSIVPLVDGSALLLGGYVDNEFDAPLFVSGCVQTTQPLGDAIRFVPTP